MKGATECAKRFRGFLKSLRSRLGKPVIPPVGNPIEQLFLGIFTRDVPEHKARDAYDHLRSFVVDFNELRVIPSLEMTEVLGEYPDARHKCEDLSRALNRIFWVEHSVSLDRLRKAARKDVMAYLERIDGLEPYTRARIRLLGLEQPAFPLDEAMLAVARRDEIIDPKCTLDEAQTFLERQVADGDHLEVYCLLKKYAWTEMERAVRKGDVEKIKSVPPDRTTRNMLRAVAEAAGHDALDADADLVDLPDVDLPDLPGLEGEPELVEALADGGAARKQKKSGKERSDARSKRASDTARPGKKKPATDAKPGKVRSRPAKAK